MKLSKKKHEQLRAAIRDGVSFGRHLIASEGRPDLPRSASGVLFEIEQDIWRRVGAALDLEDITRG